MILSIEPPEVLAAISKELAIVIASAGVRRLKLLPTPIAKGTHQYGMIFLEIQNKLLQIVEDFEIF